METTAERRVRLNRERQQRYRNRMKEEYLERQRLKNSKHKNPTSDQINNTKVINDNPLETAKQWRLRQCRESYQKRTIRLGEGSQKILESENPAETSMKRLQRLQGEAYCHRQIQIREEEEKLQNSLHENPISDQINNTNQVTDNSVETYKQRRQRQQRESYRRRQIHAREEKEKAQNSNCENSTSDQTNNTNQVSDNPAETYIQRRRRLQREAHKRRQTQIRKEKSEYLKIKNNNSNNETLSSADNSVAKQTFGPCLHCMTTDAATVDINDIKLKKNKLIVTLGECYTLITGIKLETDSPSNICQLCQSQLITSYKLQRQHQQLPSSSIDLTEHTLEMIEQTVKEENDDGPTFSTILLPCYRNQKLEVGSIDDFEILQPVPVPDEDPVREIQCDECGDMVFYRSMKLHKQSHADTETCNVCKKTFKNKHLLRSHELYQHFREHLKYRCDICGNSYMKNSVLTKHLQGHTSGKHECKHCKACFANSLALSIHTKKMHPETCLICPVPKCGEVLANKILFDHHGNLHSKIGTGCSLCVKTFNNFIGLYEHYATEHQTTKKYYDRSKLDNCRCECGKTFPLLNTLKYHIVSKPIEDRHSECRYCNGHKRNRRKKEQTMEELQLE